MIEDFDVKLSENLALDPSILENDTVSLKMYPICKCGHVFTRLSFKDGYFDPKVCPNCNRWISNISYNVPVDGVLTID